MNQKQNKMQLRVQIRNLIINKEEKLERDKLILIILSEIISQTKEFDVEKHIKYDQVSENLNLIDDPFQVQELFECFRTRLNQPSSQSDIENNCK